MDTDIKDIQSKLEIEKKAREAAESANKQLESEFTTTRDNAENLKSKFDILSNQKKKYDTDLEALKAALDDESESRAKSERAVKGKENELEDLKENLKDDSSKKDYLASVKKETRI